MSDQWLTHVQAAERLGVTTMTVQAMLARGELERRPQPRHRSMPSVGAASVEALIPVVAQRRADAAQRRIDAAQRTAEVEQRRIARRSPPDDEHEWLNAAGTAAYLGLSIPWVKNRALTGRIPATKHQGRWWIRRDHAAEVAKSRGQRASVEAWEQ